MGSASDKLHRDARDLLLMLRKVTPVTLMEAARLLEIRAKDQSIAPSEIEALFEKLRVLGWDGARSKGPETGWHVVLQCKVCLDIVLSDSYSYRPLVRSQAAGYAAASPAFHSDLQLTTDAPCHGLLEVLGLGR